MPHESKRISRREFLRISGQVVCASVAAGAGRATGQDDSCRAIRLEQQPTGSEIWQVTTELFAQSNIYCELPYCSGDGRHFLYERRNAGLPGRNKTELMLVEIGTWRQRRLDVTSGLTGCAISTDGVFYYLKRTDDKRLDLMRADLSEGGPERVYQTADEGNLTSLGTVSTDGRYYACGKRLADD